MSSAFLSPKKSPRLNTSSATVGLTSSSRTFAPATPKHNSIGTIILPPPAVSGGDSGVASLVQSSSSSSSSSSAMPPAVADLATFLAGPDCLGLLTRVWANLSVPETQQHRAFAELLTGRVRASVEDFVASECGKERTAAAAVEGVFKACCALSKRLDEPIGDAGVAEVAAGAFGNDDVSVEDFFESLDDTAARKKARVETAEGAHCNHGHHHRKRFTFSAAARKQMMEGDAAADDDAVTISLHSFAFMQLPLAEQSERLEAEHRRLRHLADDRLRLLRLIDTQRGITALPVSQQGAARTAAANAVFSTVVNHNNFNTDNNTHAMAKATANKPSGPKEADGLSSSGSAFHSARSSSSAAAKRGRSPPSTTTMLMEDAATTAGSATISAASTRPFPNSNMTNASAKSSASLSSSAVVAASSSLVGCYRQDLSAARIEREAAALMAQLAKLRNTMFRTIDEQMGEIAALLIEQKRGDTSARASQQTTPPMPSSAATAAAATRHSEQYQQHMRLLDRSEAEYDAFAAAVSSALAAAKADNGVDASFAKASVLFHEMPPAVSALFTLKMPTDVLAMVSQKLAQLQSLLYDAQLLVFADREEQVVSAFHKFYTITGDANYSKAPNYGDMLRENVVNNRNNIPTDAAITTDTEPAVQQHQPPSRSSLTAAAAAVEGVGGLLQNSASFLLTSFNEEELNQMNQMSHQHHSTWLATKASTKKVFGSCNSTVGLGGTTTAGNSAVSMLTTVTGAENEEDQHDNDNASPMDANLNNSDSRLSDATLSIRATCGQPFIVARRTNKAEFDLKMARVARAIAAYEADLASIASQLAIMSRLFSLVEERDSILVAKQQLAARSREMLLSRSAHMAQALKLDNEVRKKVASRVPQILSEIIPLCEQWERASGKRAALNGKDILHIVTSGEELILPGTQPVLVAPTAAAAAGAKAGGRGVPKLNMAKLNGGGSAPSAATSARSRTPLPSARSATAVSPRPVLSPSLATKPQQQHHQHSASAPRSVTPTPRPLGLGAGRGAVTAFKAAQQQRSVTPRTANANVNNAHNVVSAGMRSRTPMQNRSNLGAHTANVSHGAVRLNNHNTAEHPTTAAAGGDTAMTLTTPAEHQPTFYDADGITSPPALTTARSLSAQPTANSTITTTTKRQLLAKAETTHRLLQQQQHRQARRDGGVGGGLGVKKTALSTIDPNSSNSTAQLKKRLADHNKDATLMKRKGEGESEMMMVGSADVVNSSNTSRGNNGDNSGGGLSPCARRPTAAGATAAAASSSIAKKLASATSTANRIK